MAMENVSVYAKSGGLLGTAKVVIKDFVELMKASKPKDCYPSASFMVGDVPMILNVYPNGNKAEFAGCVYLPDDLGGLSRSCQVRVRH